MLNKQISLGLKYSIDSNETNFFLKKVHNYALDLLNDLPNNLGYNIYQGLTVIDFSFSHPKSPQILQILANNVCQSFPNPSQSHNILPINLDITKQKQFTFTSYSITNLQYDTVNQNLIVETILNVEELFYVGSYFNKSVFIDLNQVGNYNQGNQVQTYCIMDSADILILKVN
ncbi:hypothetical protein [Flavobacterium johnsoniae]|uniref:Uncharacterized protein n=1 Tax=Flavobacterium johnsoniae TaxID=986 RepID=A0A1M5NKD7_FLAJO|nr:hypothetical protein [Flavobacterium johnsoniae]SHG90010.1 hypothetical protein SAMN05444388_10543 [Flavobacterium johnsoniae]